MGKITDFLKRLKEQGDFIRKKFGVKKIGIFGSFARGEEKKGSDVDILVEFADGRKTFDNYMELKFFLENLFGREVDLVTSASIKPRLKENINGEIAYA